MRVGLAAKVEAKLALLTVRKIIKMLSGEELLFERRLSEKLGKPPASTASFRKADAVVAVGGDGTVLLAQRLASGVPVLGIHVAGRGFLADVEIQDLDRAIKALKAGRLEVVERERLAVTVGKKKLPDALNDVVVSRGDVGKTIDIRVKVDGENAMEMKGDGVIVSTPTGSTAYGRVAGGPVVDPRLRVSIIVPVSPADLGQAPMVVHQDSEIVVELTEAVKPALVSVDGVQEARLSTGEKLIIGRSDFPGRFFSWGDFYLKLKERL
ncbi:MAG: NAD(+)/NADH kinase [Candidatus Hadarchaeota archaeon]